jgi:hypothetical protein
MGASLRATTTFGDLISWVNDGTNDDDGKAANRQAADEVENGVALRR